MRSLVRPTPLLAFMPALKGRILSGALWRDPMRRPVTEPHLIVLYLTIGMHAR
jgi:hypothetical protein